MQKPKYHVNLQLLPEEFEPLAKLAAESGVSITAFMRNLLRAELLRAARSTRA